MSTIQYLIEQNRDKLALIRLLLSDTEKRIEALEQESLMQKIVLFAIPSDQKN